MGPRARVAALSCRCGADPGGAGGGRPPPLRQARGSSWQPLLRLPWLGCHRSTRGGSGPGEWALPARRARRASCPLFCGTVRGRFEQPRYSPTPPPSLRPQALGETAGVRGAAFPTRRRAASGSGRGRRVPELRDRLIPTPFTPPRPPPPPAIPVHGHGARTQAWGTLPRGWKS